MIKFVWFFVGLVPDVSVSRAANSSSARSSPQIGATATTAPAAGKAPSAIKTNIKSANQVHPYGR